MTLLDAVQSLGIIELAATSSITIRSVRSEQMAVFTVALLLPLLDASLSEECCGGSLRFWPDQNRLVEGGIPLQDQIRELQESHLFGNLDAIHLIAIEGAAAELWIVETHAGSHEERSAWMRSVIGLEGRTPID